MIVVVEYGKIYRYVIDIIYEYTFIMKTIVLDERGAHSYCCRKTYYLLVGGLLRWVLPDRVKLTLSDCRTANDQVDGLIG